MTDKHGSATITGFGSGHYQIDYDGNWVPPPGPELHPADALRLLISLTHENGYQLAAIVREFGWRSSRGDAADVNVDRAKDAEQQGRETISGWLRDGAIKARTEHGAIDPKAWLRIDLDDSATWWPLDVPGRGCWRVPKHQVITLAKKLSLAANSSGLQPIPQKELEALPSRWKNGLDASGGQDAFVNWAIANAKSQGWKIAEIALRRVAKQNGITLPRGRPKKN